MKYRELYKVAQKAMENAYAPFSKFKVGTALLVVTGEVFTGVNVENSSFGATICAEQTAFVKAISEGERAFEAIAICSSDGSAWPCGICRQVMMEFCDSEFLIVTGDDEDNLQWYKLSEMLPEGFKL